MMVEAQQVEITSTPKPAFHQRRWPIIIVALVLAGAAILKLAGLGVQTVSSLGILTDPSIQLAIIEIELAVAIWLWWDSNPIGSWLSAITLFIVFSGVTLYQAFEGQASCGCFGYLRVAPGQALLIDIACLVLLICGRPALIILWANPRGLLVQNLPPFGKGIICLAIIFITLSGFAYGIYGSPSRALAMIRGERISISPRVLDLGTITTGETSAAAVEIRNWSDRPVTLVGGTADCSCKVRGQLPCTVPAGQAMPVEFALGLSGSPGRFARTAWLFVDDDGLRSFRFQIIGRSVRSKH